MVDYLDSGTLSTADEIDAPPTVSIIMGAYNAGNTIREAIDSVIAQEFTDWEFIICDDNSDDDTLRICLEYATRHPGRFQVLSNERNLKLPATLNRCLSASRGRYIARMDADDRSAPDRLEKQIATLEAQPWIDLVGTAMQRFDTTEIGAKVQPPTCPDRNTLRRTLPFCHATIVARRRVYDVIGGYNESPRTSRGQDLELWFNFYEHGFVGINLQEPLYFVREDSAAIRRRQPKVRWNAFRTMVMGYRKLGYPIYCYIRPVLELSKILVPYSVQGWYRRWQTRQAKVRAS